LDKKEKFSIKNNFKTLNIISRADSRLTEKTKKNVFYVVHAQIWSTDSCMEEPLENSTNHTVWLMRVVRDQVIRDGRSPHGF